MVLGHLCFYLIFSMFWHPVPPYFWSCFWPHFCQFLPSKIGLFTKHRKLRCMAYIWVFTSCWSRSWVLFWCFTCVFSWFWNTCVFTSYFPCFGILFLHTFGLVFGLHFCTLLPSKMHLFTKHRKLRCIAYIWVFTCAGPLYGHPSLPALGSCGLVAPLVGLLVCEPKP